MTGAVNGGWSMWGEWIVGSCPVTCGGSTTQRHRIRECTNPPPANGGEACRGFPFEQESFSCGNELCPGIVQALTSLHPLSLNFLASF